MKPRKFRHKETEETYILDGDRLINETKQVQIPNNTRMYAKIRKYASGVYVPYIEEIGAQAQPPPKRIVVPESEKDEQTDIPEGEYCEGCGLFVLQNGHMPTCKKHGQIRISNFKKLKHENCERR